MNTAKSDSTNMNVGTVSRRTMLAGITLAATGATVMLEESCTPTSGNSLTVILGAVTAAVNVLVPVLAEVGVIPVALVPLIQSGLVASQTFVTQATSILADTSLTTAQRITQIVTAAAAAYAALNIPGLPAGVQLIINTIIKTIEVFVITVQGSTLVTAATSHTVTAAPVKVSAADLAKVKSAAEAQIALIKAAFKAA